MMPRRVARHLAVWGYDPAHPTYGDNFLSRRVERAKGENERNFAFGSLCAVPHSANRDLYQDYNDVVGWLVAQNLTHYEPGGVWLPLSTRTFASPGLILAEDDYTRDASPRLWRAYLLAGRDGYFEHGRQVGWTFREYMIYPFAPMVAWIQQFTSLLQEAKTKQSSDSEYSIVLNLPELERAVLVSLGDGWREPFEWSNDRERTPIETRVQLHLTLGERTPQEVGRWFAERVDNIFGFNEALPRCYNHPASRGTVGPPGTLPTNRFSYR